MEGKKIAAAVVLIVVIVAALYFVATKVSGGTKPPPLVMGQAMEMISVNGGEPVTKSMGEWEAGGIKNGMFKNPVTGEYDMVSVTTCFSCNEKIPVQLPPPEVNSIQGGPGAVEKWRATVACPKCGKNPFPPQGLSAADIMKMRGATGTKGPGKAPATKK